MKLERLIREEIRGQRAYFVESLVCPVKLDANESPYGLSPELRERFLFLLKDLDLNRYPEAGSMSLRASFAARFGVSPESLTVGNGSDELIAILCTALSSPGSQVLIPIPTFAMYRIAALNSGHRVIEVPLGRDFDLDRETMLRTVRREQPAIVFLSYPNNPTGNCFDEETIEAILAAAEGVVVVDEAYYPFAGRTFVPLLERYDNLVVLRTLSKLGLAALRIGFLMGSPALVAELEKVRLPYNVNALSQAGALFYLEEETFFSSQVIRIIEERNKVSMVLREMTGVHPVPSLANFIFFSCDFDTDRVYIKLIEEGVLIKNLNSPGPLRNCMRVTIGKPEENEEFIRAFRGASIQ